MAGLWLLKPEVGDPGPGIRERLGGAEQPLRILLTCFHVLQAAGDARTPGILRCAHDWLHGLAGSIPEEDRSGFSKTSPGTGRLRNDPAMIRYR